MKRVTISKNEAIELSSRTSSRDSFIEDFHSDGAEDNSGDESQNQSKQRDPVASEEGSLENDVVDEGCEFPHVSYLGPTHLICESPSCYKTHRSFFFHK